MTTETQAPEGVDGWVTMWPSVSGGRRAIYSPGATKPSYGPELDARLTVYPVYAAPQQAPAEGDELPPLPAPRLRFEVAINQLGERMDYTAADMQAYARAALAAQPQAAPVALTDEQMTKIVTAHAGYGHDDFGNVICAAIAEFCRVNGIPAPKEPTNDR